MVEDRFINNRYDLRFFSRTNRLLKTKKWVLSYYMRENCFFFALCRSVDREQSVQGFGVSIR